MAVFEPKQFGRFYLLEKLAVGGMAEIYKAKTFGAEGFEKLLAIKRILPHCSADKDFITMLIDEAKLSVLLSHANVVQVYDLGKVGDDFFISMEYINGVNLRDILYRSRERMLRMPPELAVYMASEVCKGLDYAHRKTDPNGQPLNIVHRDVSPQNVLISYEGEVKIVDFGIAKAAMNISHTMAGILKGKIAYMSPEQALGKSIDYRTDIFSVGILLYECLTGEKLFTGESQFEVLKKIRTTKIDVTKLPAGIPKALQQILVKGLAYFPKDRFQSAGDMQIELTKFLYSTYVDFSPQKLAGYVKELFRDELERQQRQAALQLQLEAQTSSINVAQEAAQQDIVVREETGLTLKAPRRAEDVGTIATPFSTEHTVETMKGQQERLGLRVAATLGIVAAVALGTVAYVQFLHPRLFPPEAPEPIYGTINITSNPPGAQIFLSGQDMKLSTPAVLENLALNTSYTLKLTKENYADLEQTISVTSPTPLSIALTLAEAGGTLEVRSTPTGAAISIDGQASGKVTPATIGGLTLHTDHHITLSKEQFQDFQQTLSLKSPKPEELVAALQPIGAEQPPRAPQNGNTFTAKLPETLPPEPLGPKVTSVSIKSTPTGATILLDGRDTGLRTPARLEKLAVGSSHTIRLEKANHESWSRQITIAKAEPIHLRGQLKAMANASVAPIEKISPSTVEKKTMEKGPPPEAVESGGGPGSIKVSSNPSGAEVFINGESRGSTPATIAGLAGSVKVLITKEGYAPYSTRVTIKPGQTVSLGTVALGDMYGEVNVSSSPAGAMVYIDGQATAKTPVTIRKVRRDKGHSLRVTLDGYHAWEHAFNFGGDGEKRFHADLQEQ